MGTWIQSSKHSQPKQYLQGFVEFYKLKFKVDGRVLIPRPETELLVDEVLAFVGSDPRTLTILDMGTGSGNIAISLAKNLPNARIFATDISEEALELAKENAKLQNVSDRIIFVVSDLLQSFYDSSLITLPSSLILVSNLPYIPTQRIPYLDPSVKDFEPRIALDGGVDGFELYRKLFRQINHKFPQNSPGANVNHPPGVLGTGVLGRHLGRLELIVCEIDYTQGELAVSETHKLFPDAKVEVKTDLNHKQRIVIIKP